MPHFHFLKLLHISKIIHNLDKSRKWQAHMLYSIHTHTHVSLLIKPSAFLDLLFFSNSFKYILLAIKGNQVKTMKQQTHNNK